MDMRTMEPDYTIYTGSAVNVPGYGLCQVLKALDDHVYLVEVLGNITQLIYKASYQTNDIVYALLHEKLGDRVPRLVHSYRSTPFDVLEYLPGIPLGEYIQKMDVYQANKLIKSYSEQMEMFIQAFEESELWPMNRTLDNILIDTVDGELVVRMVGVTNCATNRQKWHQESGIDQVNEAVLETAFLKAWVSGNGPCNPGNMVR